MSPKAPNAAVARSARDTCIVGWKSNLIKKTYYNNIGSYYK